jgi:hypothetical protein
VRWGVVEGAANWLAHAIEMVERVAVTETNDTVAVSPERGAAAIIR